MENLHDAYITRENVCVCLHEIVLLCANFKHSNLIILGLLLFCFGIRLKLAMRCTFKQSVRDKVWKS